MLLWNIIAYCIFINLPYFFRNWFSSLVYLKNQVSQQELLFFLRNLDDNKTSKVVWVVCSLYVFEIHQHTSFQFDPTPHITEWSVSWLRYATTTTIIIIVIISNIVIMPNPILQKLDKSKNAWNSMAQSETGDMCVRTGEELNFCARTFFCFGLFRLCSRDFYRYSGYILRSVRIHVWVNRIDTRRMSSELRFDLYDFQWMHIYWIWQRWNWIGGFCRMIIDWSWNTSNLKLKGLEQKYSLKLNCKIKTI